MEKLDIIKNEIKVYLLKIFKGCKNNTDRANAFWIYVVEKGWEPESMLLGADHLSDEQSEQFDELLTEIIKELGFKPETIFP